MRRKDDIDYAVDAFMDMLCEWEDEKGLDMTDPGNIAKLVESFFRS